MSTTHLRDLDIVTLDHKGTIHRDAELVIQDGRITHVGQAPAGLRANEVIDASGRVALPGLYNSHCHSPMTFERCWAEDLVFPKWLQEIWVVENELTSDDVYWGAQLAAAEMIRTGTVGFNDLYFHMDRVAQVVRESGMKAALSWCFFDAGEGSVVSQNIEQTVEWIKALEDEQHPRIRTFLGPHSAFTCSQKTLEYVVELAHELGQGIHIHLAEDQAQVDQSLERYGLRPVQHVDGVGIFDTPGGCIAAHTLVIDERDTEILAEKGVYTPHCPITYMKLAMPFPSFKDRLEAGVRVPLGTDGPGSNSDMDMFAAIRQTALIHKYQQLDPEMISGDMALRMATQMGAAALGFADSGVIQVNAPADVILVNKDTPHMRPVHDLVANLIHTAKGSDVTDVMVDGQWLMRKRELLTLDEERILYEAEAHAQALVKRAGR
jgi:5-methylthioadenosine/S-adenosylhomocysteine deaminase